MYGRAGHWLLACLSSLATPPLANAGCIDPEQLLHSTVSIIRHFDDVERDARPNLIGVRGTAWFLSPRTIVTAEHVASAMKLSTQAWKPLDITDANGSQSIAARIQRVAGVQTEKLAIIELQQAVSEARSVAIRKEPLVPDEQVLTLAYPAGHLHSVRGRFVQFGDGEKLAGLALLEIYEGENRLVIDHGASGAPVIDCSGRVVAVVSNVFTQSLWWGSHQITVSTAWGMPNVASVPVQVLDETSQPDVKL